LFASSSTATVVVTVCPIVWIQNILNITIRNANEREFAHAEVCSSYLPTLDGMNYLRQPGVLLTKWRRRKIGWLLLVGWLLLIGWLLERLLLHIGWLLERLLHIGLLLHVGLLLRISRRLLERLLHVGLLVVSRRLLLRLLHVGLLVSRLLRLRRYLRYWYLPDVSYCTHPDSQHDGCSFAFGRNIELVC
jgi:hypothetical protein